LDIPQSKHLIRGGRVIERGEPLAAQQEVDSPVGQTWSHFDRAARDLQRAIAGEVGLVCAPGKEGADQQEEMIVITYLKIQLGWLLYIFHLNRIWNLLLFGMQHS